MTVERSDQKITFLIVSYNSARTLRSAIESCVTAVEQCYPTNGKIVVYDNASTDDCPQIIDEFSYRYSSIFIGIKGDQNLGFGRANNQAAKVVLSDVYVLINPDVAFEPQMVIQLVMTLQSANDIAIVCPKLLYPDTSVQPSIRRFPSFTYFLLRQLLGEGKQRVLYPFDYCYADVEPPEETVEVDWAIGAFMVVSGKYAAQHGLFDERFFLYFEDVSLCVDAWQNGYRVLFQPTVTALHQYQRASTRSRFNYLTLLHTVSALKFFAKYKPYKKRWKTVVLLLQFGLTLKHKSGSLRNQIALGEEHQTNPILSKTGTSA